MKKTNLLPSIVLGCICLVAALLLSVVNKFTAPIIEKNKNAAASGAFVEVLPGATGKVDLTIDEKYPSTVKAGYKFDNGFVFQIEETGKASGFVIMVGIDLEGKVIGAKVISNQETPSYAANVFADIKAVDNTYNGTTLDTFAPSLVAGATLTSDAYGRAVKAALQSYVLASGGSVDTRTEEEKFQDACNELLGTTNLNYTKWFATEVITGIDAVYESGENRIYKIGEKLIGIKADGTVVSADATDAEKATATAADTIIKAGALTEITSQLTDSKFADITKASVTASGNYVFELNAEGYKSENVNHFGGNAETSYIKIKVAIDSEGKIIDVVTVSHKETAGIGDKCATDAYYQGWIGAEGSDVVISADRNDFDLEDYTMDLIPSDSTDLGVIGGATFTTVAYQEAIELAFTAFETLTEGGND